MRADRRCKPAADTISSPTASFSLSLSSWRSLQQLSFRAALLGRKSTPSENHRLQRDHINYKVGAIAKKMQEFVKNRDKILEKFTSAAETGARIEPRWTREVRQLKKFWGSVHFLDKFSRFLARNSPKILSIWTRSRFGGFDFPRKLRVGSSEGKFVISHAWLKNKIKLFNFVE